MIKSQFSETILRWFDDSQVTLPWRGTRDPYRIWVSEIMLQQTQIATVIPYYERWMEHYPDVLTLAAAPLDDVLKQWEGLGYYSRARNLHRAAQQIVRDGGAFPHSAETLRELPGIGRYTAAAIASIAYGERVAVLDGNVIRVLSRVNNLEKDVTLSKTQGTLWEMADSLISESRPGDYNQAVMDLGRLVCKVRQPLCTECPAQSWCEAYRLGIQEQRPVKARRAPTPHYDVAAGVIWNTMGELLIAQRPANGLLGGLWEFPGGKQELDETLEVCLQRELREELAIEVSVGERLTTVRHAFTHFKITLAAFECQHLAGEPQAIGCQAWRWVRPTELDGFAFGKADLEVIKALRRKPGRLL